MRKDLIYKGVKFSKYHIDDKGKITRKSTLRLIKPFDDDRGYDRVDLMSDQNEVVRVKVHIASAHTFLGTQPEHTIINHKDGNKKNNAYKNLEYISQRENVAHAQKLIKNLPYMDSDTAEEILRMNQDGKPILYISEQVKLPYHVVRDFLQGKTYQHYGTL